LELRPDDRPPSKEGWWREASRPLRECCAGGVRAIWVFGLCLSVAACGSMSGSLWHGPVDVAAPASQAAPPDRSEQIGSGPARVALIVPLTQASGPSVVGTSLRNAAELAYLEAGGNDVTLLVKDDRSNPDSAREAAQAALSEGAELVIGPLFASSVREVGKVARAAGKPVIAFSTDTSTAGQGSFCCPSSSKTTSTGSSISPRPKARSRSPPSFRKMTMAACGNRIPAGGRPQQHQGHEHRALRAADHGGGGAKDRRTS